MAGLSRVVSIKIAGKYGKRRGFVLKIRANNPQTAREMEALAYRLIAQAGLVVSDKKRGVAIWGSQKPGLKIWGLKKKGGR